MFQFLESIKIQNGVPQLLEWHQKRVEDTLRHHGYNTPIDLYGAFADWENIDMGIFKWRVLYNADGIDFSEIVPYIPKKVETFRLIEADISYGFKYVERDFLNQYSAEFPHQEVIFTRQGKLTDTSCSNLIFFKNNKWYTPDTYLLNGVQRQYLLSKGEVSCTEIHRENFRSFSHFAMINAMLEKGEGQVFTIDKIVEIV